MEHKLVRCPETGCLEELDIERTNLGVLVEGCSRHRRCKLECARLCAARMDLSDRLEERREDDQQIREGNRTADWPAPNVHD